MSIQIAPGARSARLTHDSNTDVPAEKDIRPLRDQIILEPINVALSKIIVVHEDTKPLRGIVKRVGPGCYPKVYDHPDKHRRTKMWDSEVFQPCVVKPGDVVELGGYGHQGYTFPSFYWGGKLHLIIREADVSGVLEGVEADAARAEAEAVTI